MSGVPPMALGPSTGTASATPSAPNTPAVAAAAAGAAGTPYLPPGWDAIDARVTPTCDPFSGLSALASLLHRLRVPQIVEVLKGVSTFTYHMSSTGRKAQIIDRIVSVANEFYRTRQTTGSQSMMYLHKMIDVQFHSNKAVPVRLYDNNPGFIRAQHIPTVGAPATRPPAYTHRPAYTPPPPTALPARSYAPNSAHAAQFA